MERRLAGGAHRRCGIPIVAATIMVMTTILLCTTSTNYKRIHSDLSCVCVTSSLCHAAFENVVTMVSPRNVVEIRIFTSDRHGVDGFKRRYQKCTGRDFLDDSIGASRVRSELTLRLVGGSDEDMEVYRSKRTKDFLWVSALPVSEAEVAMSFFIAQSFLPLKPTLFHVVGRRRGGTRFWHQLWVGVMHANSIFFDPYDKNARVTYHSRWTTLPLDFVTSFDNLQTALALYTAKLRQLYLPPSTSSAVNQSTLLVIQSSEMSPESRGLNTAMIKTLEEAVPRITRVAITVVDQDSRLFDLAPLLASHQTVFFGWGADLLPLAFAHQTATWITVVRPANERGADLEFHVALANASPRRWRLVICEVDSDNQPHVDGLRKVLTAPWGAGVARVRSKPKVNMTMLRRNASTTAGVARLTEIVCVCTPVGASDAGCNAVLFRAPALVRPEESLTVFIHADSEDRFQIVLDSIYQCIGGTDVAMASRLYWLELGSHKVNISFKRATADHTSECRRMGWTQALQWYIARMFSYSPYHFTFDRGVFQLFSMLRQLHSLLPPRHAPRRTIVNLIHETFVRSSPHDYKPLHVFMEAIIPQLDYRVYSGGFQCTEAITFGYGGQSPMRYSMDGAIDEPLKSEIRDFAATLTQRLFERYGPPLAPRRALFINSGPVMPHDEQGRARGVRAEFIGPLIRGFGTSVNETEVTFLALDESVPMKQQFHVIQGHEVIISGEGAFFVLMLLAAPRTTFVMVYDHIRKASDWKHSNFHTPIASALDIRLIVFVIDNGISAPLTDLIALIKSPWRRGVFHLGANQFGHRQ